MSSQTREKRAQRRPEMTRYEIAAQWDGQRDHYVANIYRNGRFLSRVEGKDEAQVLRHVGEMMALYVKGESKKRRGK